MSERISPLAGKPVPPSLLVNIPRLVTAYFALVPDPSIASQRVAFGTSGHRGSAFAAAFNEAHILAIAQAVCLYRRHAGIDGPLFLGMDTHALSEAGLRHRYRGARGQRRRDDDRRAWRLYADAGDLARDPFLQSRPKDGPGGRDRDQPLAQSARRGRLQIQPANGGPADVDVTGWIEKSRERIPRQEARWCRAHSLRARAQGGVHSCP